MFEKIISLLKHFTGTQETESTGRAASIQEPAPASAPTSATTTATEKNTDEVVIQFNTLGKFGLGFGSIGPEKRSDIEQNLLSDMYKRISSGEFNVPVSGVLPEICVDGRTDKNGARKMAPSAAGGTLSIVYGGDLGGDGSASGKTELQLTAEVVDALQKKGHATGVHGDNHSSCGCGACAKASTVYQHIVEHINNITELTKQYGIEVTEPEKALITAQAKNRLSQPDFFSGDRAAVLQTAQTHGAGYEELVDAHNELGIALNTRPGTTVDRAAIRKVFGPQYDMFVVDAWTFGSAAKEVNPTGNDQDVARIAKAITLQNVATASVLGHSSLPLVPIG